MPASGTIQIQATTSRAEIPVEGAFVTIALELPGGGRELISLQRTDENGKTPPVTVSTPEFANSQTPDQAQGWTDVVVTISSPEYEGIVVTSAQIFPGVATVQDMVLIPRADLPSDSEGVQDYDVPGQGL